MLLCKDTNCSIHNQDIDSFYNSIISVFKQATIECIPSSNNCNKKFIPIPGWNEYVREHHKIARDAFQWWNLNNRPRDGYIYHEMRTAGPWFKYALRFTRSIEDTARADSLLCPQKVTGPSYNKHCTTYIFQYRLSASIYPRQVLFTVYAWSGLWNGMITGI